MLSCLWAGGVLARTEIPGGGGSGELDLTLQCHPIRIPDYDVQGVSHFECLAKRGGGGGGGPKSHPHKLVDTTHKC